ncbi:hypothetical protein INT43_005483 [Umbelopsis isabellina]|uniref:Uncharacterized protein n=1 Tax=Mortierella isabellina TaxID=91625 RepID=A0A8H7PLB2_MORIS|nr:hypothetical protein INT43_005483 [Umbelopsis isabellina]
MIYNEGRIRAKEVYFPPADFNPYAKIPTDIDWVREDYYLTVLGKMMNSSASGRTLSVYLDHNQRRYHEALNVGTRWNTSFDRYHNMLKYQQECEERQKRLHHRASTALQEAQRADRMRRSALCNEILPNEANSEGPHGPRSMSDDHTCVADEIQIGFGEDTTQHANEKTGQLKKNDKSRLVHVMKRMKKNMGKSIKDACCWHPIV